MRTNRLNGIACLRDEYAVVSGGCLALEFRIGEKIARHAFPVAALSAEDAANPARQQCDPGRARRSALATAACSGACIIPSMRYRFPSLRKMV